MKTYTPAATALREARRRRKMSQEVLAASIGKVQPQVAALETNARFCSRATALAIRDALAPELPASWIACATTEATIAQHAHRQKISYPAAAQQILGQLQDAPQYERADEAQAVAAT